MKRTALAAAILLSVSPNICLAQESSGKARKAATPAGPTLKAGKGEKVCRHKFPDGTPKTWICKSDEPCCAWDEIKYVKCGSATFKCL